MATAIQISALTDELISIVANISDSSSPRFKDLKSLTRRLLKQSPACRTDKFEVARRLDGLQEKFQILGNDPLADALHQRLVELDARNRYWSPEVLFLLLELSDEPATKSKPGAIEQLKPPDPPPVLTWSDLGTSDLDQENIWDFIDYTNGSSDDNLSTASSDVSIPRIIPQSSRVPLDEFIPPGDIFLNVEDKALVSSIQKSLAWRNASNGTSFEENSALTELQVTREVIFMLQGLPNSLFRDVQDAIEVDPRFSMNHASKKALGSILGAFGHIGVCVRRLRAFSAGPLLIPFMQMFQRELEKLVSEFNEFLSNKQIQCSARTGSPLISLLELFDVVHKETKLLVDLADLVAKYETSTEQREFLCLDLLYDLTCAKQAAAEDGDFKTIAKIFLRCFEIYAKPIQLWMRTGMLDESLGSFFVKRSAGSTDLKHLWQDWYVLEKALSEFYGPKLLRPAAEKIFTAGKSMVFLRNLGVLPETLDLTEEPIIADVDIFSEKDISQLVPFSGLLQTSLGRLMNANHAIASSILRTELDEKCGLWLSLQALDYIYLAKDTTLLMAVDQRIFDLIDKGRQSWNDRFLLTENFQQAFGNLSCINADRIIARAAKISPRDFERLCRSVKILKALSVDYVLPWPIANIISKQAMLTYQRVSTFLMQIRRAKYVLEKQCSNKPKHLRLEGYTKEDILAFSIRHHLLWFLNIVYYHFTELVAFPSGNELRKEMTHAKDVDQMISVFQSFTSSLEEQCLLSQPLAPIYQAIISLFDLCLRFSDVQVARYAEYQHDQANQSTTYLHLSRPYRRRHRLASKDEDTSSDEDEDDSEEHIINDTMFGDGNSTCISFAELSYRERLLDVKEKFDQLCGFIKAGLRGVGRVNGRNSWEMLADRLEWKSDTLV
ncbi:predicted protein [Uncinocarpus reesii 1704]|uniref:Spindle pole body component n=1 Tax=Uncinocarpus reesii (strain UAMH 1704) TaxID=336963 RepID=C4JM89_UNCRE|nr:uncharacterized protein UREG_03947 [Uncinocarpus reesii 1704]EEP79101.1 predicted protein [Uncinocarpus reesii 1704]